MHVSGAMQAPYYGEAQNCKMVSTRARVTATRSAMGTHSSSPTRTVGACLSRTSRRVGPVRHPADRRPLPGARFDCAGEQRFDGLLMPIGALERDELARRLDEAVEVDGVERASVARLQGQTTTSGRLTARECRSVSGRRAPNYVEPVSP